ncbi:hypothetical protein MTO96_051359 [Rhipicephalus appendiculatus]
MFLSPIVIMAKVVSDASWVTPPLRPVMDANATDFAFRLSFDITNDENVWSGIAGGLAVVPYYMMKNLADVPMLRGLFLAGVVGASTSTVSSIVNSHAAIFYIDVVTPYVKLSEKKAVVVMRLLAEDIEFLRMWVPASLPNNDLKVLTSSDIRNTTNVSAFFFPPQIQGDESKNGPSVMQANERDEDDVRNPHLDAELLPIFKGS